PPPQARRPIEHRPARPRRRITTLPSISCVCFSWIGAPCSLVCLSRNAKGLGREREGSGATGNETRGQTFRPLFRFLRKIKKRENPGPSVAETGRLPG